MSGRWSGIWIGLMAGAAALLLLHGAVYASGEAAGARLEPGTAAQSAQRFRSSAESLYTAVVDGDRNTSYYELVKLKKIAGDENLRNQGRKEGWKIIDRDLAEARSALGADAEPDKLLQSAARLRLAADSLAAGESALWLRYEPLLRDDIRQMTIAWTTSGSLAQPAAAARLETLIRHWNVIEPAVWLNRDSIKAQTMSELMGYSSRLLQGERESSPTWILQSFRSLSEATGALFHAAGTGDSGQAEPVVALPIGPGPAGGWLLYSLVPLIASVLGYAGWSNYRRGQHGVTVHPPKSEPPSRNGVANHRR